MRRLDRYDAIGIAVATLVAAMWIAHFVLPAPPPLPPDDNAPGLSAPGLAPPGVGR